MGDRVGDRVMGQAVSYLATRHDAGWKVEFEDIIAGP